MNRLERVTRAAALAAEAKNMLDRHWLDADYTGRDIEGAHGALSAAIRLLAAALVREGREAKPEQD